MKILRGLRKYLLKILRKFKFIIKFPRNYLENLTQTLKKFLRIKKINEKIHKKKLWKNFW